MLHRSPLPLRPGSPSPLHFHTWWAALAGLCASLVGIGLGRFAYTPLIPALVAAGWFTPSQAVYLGAANLAGYLVGALAARRLTARWGTRSVLRGMMLVASAFLDAPRTCRSRGTFPGVWPRARLAVP